MKTIFLALMALAVFTSCSTDECPTIKEKQQALNAAHAEEMKELKRGQDQSKRDSEHRLAIFDIKGEWVAVKVETGTFSISENYRTYVKENLEDYGLSNEEYKELNNKFPYKGGKKQAAYELLEKKCK